MDERITVDFRGGREEQPGAPRSGQAQGVARTESARFQRLDREPKIVHRAGRRGEVEDPFDLPLDLERLRHVPLEKREPRLTPQVGKVASRPRDQAVDADDGVPLGEEAVGEVRTEEAGGAGDDQSHAISAGPICLRPTG